MENNIDQAKLEEMDRIAIDKLVSNGQVALEEFRKLDQKQVDYIVAKCSVAALDNHGSLAMLAIEETKRTKGSASEGTPFSYTPSTPDKAI